ncbi:MAG: V-type ATPase 116kDa subunit family protein [Gallionellaceae bacterium]|nr:V-type ATPase 116kDa subunit family protein [Gallionellaceae bacterium]
MSRVTLYCLTSEAQDAALLLARHGLFGLAADENVAFPESPGDEYREIYLEADARLAKIGELCGHLEVPPIPPDVIAPNLRELIGINNRLRELWQKCSACAEHGQKIEEDLRRLAALRDTFERLKTLDVDVSRLLKADSLLDSRIGQVPKSNVQRLKEALQLAGYLLTVFDQAGEQAFVVVAGPRSNGELGGVLSQAGWRELMIPLELQTHPEIAGKYLERETARLQGAEAQYCDLKVQSVGEQREWLGQARLLLALARPLAETALGGLRGKGQLVSISGWVPKAAVPRLRRALAERFTSRYLIASRDPDPGERGQIPSFLEYPVWLRPFVPLVKSYGIPRYGEFDPSLLFALTYLLLFGAMFGDVGHGGVILVLALLLYRKLGQVAWVGIAAGVASMGFGLLYGSIFGYEDVLTPVWLSPLHDPIRVLTVAILFGVGFIVFTLLANIWNTFTAGHVAEALFDSTGLAGLLFYLGAATGLAGEAGLPAVSGLSAPAWSLALLGITTVAVFKWVETRASLGERALVTAIETLETGINLFANTLSFMRVAAFSLNHVALALAVFTIAGGLDTTGHWLTILLGNVVIIVLEGGIVAIQALRLMYYEGFSRFFSGDGTEFVPLKLVGVK